jgi:hypothetical protein
MRTLINQIYEVKKIKKELREKDAALAERREYRQKKADEKMPRLGFLKYQEPQEDLKLTSELTGTLRQMVPEGHILTDRLHVRIFLYIIL